MSGFCPKCGSPTRADAVFCGLCGHELRPQHDDPEPVRVRPRWAVPAAIAAGGAALMLMLVHFLLLKDPGADEIPAATATQLAVDSSATPAVDASANPAAFNVRAFCASHPNDPGPGEQDANAIPPEVKAAGADFWRCAGGSVKVCSGGASGRACAQQAPVDPTYLAELDRFCASNPGVGIPYAVSGPGRDWTCQGRVPTPDGTDPVDAFGFMVGSWRDLGQGGLPPEVDNRISAAERYGNLLLGIAGSPPRMESLRMVASADTDTCTRAIESTAMITEIYKDGSGNITAMTIRDAKATTSASDTHFGGIDLSALPADRQVMAADLIDADQMVRISSRGCGSALVPDLVAIARIRS